MGLAPTEPGKMEESILVPRRHPTTRWGTGTMPPYSASCATPYLNGWWLVAACRLKSPSRLNFGPWVAQDFRLLSSKAGLPATRSTHLDSADDSQFSDCDSQIPEGWDQWDAA